MMTVWLLVARTSAGTAGGEGHFVPSLLYDEQAAAKYV
jgi:hypothetical protein